MYWLLILLQIAAAIVNKRQTYPSYQSADIISVARAT